VEQPGKMCVICNAELTYYKKENYYKCPVCFTEVWPDEERLKHLQKEKKRRETAEQDRERSKWRVGWDSRTEVLPIYPYPSGKSSSRSGKKRRKPPKKVRRDIWYFK